VALANIQALDQEGIVERVRQDTGPYLQQLLRQTFAQHPLIGEIQGQGFLAALQFAQDKATRTLFDNEADVTWRCRTLGFEEGVIVRSTAGRIIMAPTLVMTRPQLDELVDKTRRAVDRTAQELGVL
jgi:adenosylmethionine-8-amino-7-oxononanoate aminotransferase